MDNIINRRFIPICQYQLYRERQMTVILLIVLAINFILGAVLKTLETRGGSIDIVTMVFAPVIGYTLFSDTFKFATYNGTARKNYLAATCVTAVVLSAAWSLLTSVIMLFAERFTSAHLLFTQVYPNGFFGMFVWIAAAILCLLMFGWLISILMFSLSRKTKRLLLLAGSVLVPLTILLNVLTDGLIMNALQKVKLFFFGVVGQDVYLILSVGMLMLLSGGFCAIAWCFIKKAEV